MLKYLVVFLVLILSLPAGAQEPVKIIYCEYPPFYFMGKSNQPRGILVDFWKLWSQKTKIEVEFKITTWENSITAVINGSADIHAGIYFTDQRDQDLDFTQSFMDLPTHLFYTTQINPEGLVDLAGQETGVVPMDYNTGFLKHNQSDAVIIEYKTYQAIVRAALDGEIKAFLMEKPVAMTYLAKMNGLKKIRTSKTPLHVKHLHGAVRKNRLEFLKTVNQGIKDISPAEIKKIVRSWMGETKPAVQFPSANTIIIANSVDSIPYHFVDPQGRPMGLTVDLWRLWSQKTGVNIQFKSADFSKSVDYVRQGQAEIHAGLFFSPARDQFLDYSVPLCDVTTHFFFHQNIYGLKNLEDLLGFKIGVIKGDYALEFLQKKLPEATLAQYDNNHCLFEAVARGEIKVFIKDTQIALAFLAQKGLLQTYHFHPEKPLYSKKFHGAVQAGNQKLLKLINQGLSEISTYQRAEIERRWTGISNFKTKNTLVIACPQAYPPFSSLNLVGRPAGMLVDFWNLWAQKTNTKIEFRATSLIQTIRNIKDGSADIHAGLSQTVSRDWLTFSRTFYQAGVSLLFPAEQKEIKSIKALRGHKVGIIKASYTHHYLGENWPAIIPVSFDTCEDMITSANKGEIRAFLMETSTVSILLSRLGLSSAFRFLKPTLFTHNIRAGVKKGQPQLTQLVTQGIDAITTPELIEIEARWIMDPKERYFREKGSEIILTDEEKKWLENHKIIRTRIDPAWPPFEYKDANGRYQGMAVDYLRILEEKIGITMELIPDMEWNQAVQWAKDRKVDLFLFLIPSDDHRGYLNFSKPYLSSPLVIVTRTQEDFVGGLQDLYNHTIAIEKNYYLHGRISEEHPEINLILVNTTEEALETVSLGKAKAYAGSLMVVSHILNQRGFTNLKVAAPTKYGNQDLCIAIRKDWPVLQHLVDKTLASITPQKHNEIRNRWVAIRYEHGISKEDIVKSGIVVGVILLIILLWNHQIRRREERFRGLTEHSTDITQAFDQQGYIVYQSPSHAFLGYKKNALLGKLAPGLFHPDDLPQWELVKKALLEAEEVQSFVHQLRQQDGTYLHFESKCTNLLNNKALKAFVLHAHDITERLQKEEDLKIAKQAAEVANKAKGEFLAGMSHEIRTPMNAILGVADMLWETSLNKEQKNFVRLFRNAGKSLLEILNDILDVSRLTTGQFELEDMPFNLEDSLKKTCEVMNFDAAKKGLELKCAITPKTPCDLIGDAKRLRQILVNLIGNAIKFTSTGSIEVTVTSNKTEAELMELVFAVKDTGIGIPEQEQTKIFNRFTQADASTTRRYGGSGLGLSICKNLIELMQGQIRVESIPGSGSTFYFTIKVSVNHNPSVRSEPVLISARAGISARRILLVEDNPDNQMVFCFYLKRISADIDIAENGVLGFEKVIAGNYDIIFMDIEMPLMDGYETTRRIRQWEQSNQRQAVKIVALTAHAMKSERRKFFDAGMDAFVIKPIEPNKLYAQLGQHPNLPQEKPDRPSLPGIKIKAALRRLGSQDLLEKLILNMPGHYEKDIRALLLSPQARSVLKSGAVTQALQLCHTIKGVAGNIAAEGLSAAARNLETFLRKEGDLQNLTPLLDKFESAYNQILESVKIIQTNPRETPALKPSNRTVIKQLDQLEELIKANNPLAQECADQLMNHPDANKFKQNLEQLSQALERFDFKGGLKIFKLIKRD